MQSAITDAVSYHRCVPPARYAGLLIPPQRLATLASAGLTTDLPLRGTIYVITHLLLKPRLDINS
jgi:hypothetical protein